MMASRWTWAVACVAWLWLGTGQAFAQTDTAAADTEGNAADTDTDTDADADADRTEAARDHFRRGVQLYADGDIGGALVEFQAAYALQPSYRLLYNLAQVRAELLDYAGAERTFVRYLEEGGADIDEQRRLQVEAELERLRQRIGTLTVVSDPPGAEVFVDDEPVGQTPLQALAVSAGQRRLRIQQSGFEAETRVVNVIGAQAQRLEFELQRQEALIVEVQATRGSHAALWAGIATGVVLIGAGGLSLWTYQAQRDYDDALYEQNTRSRLDDLRQGAERRALYTDIAFGVAAVGAVVTTVLWALDDDGEAPQQTSGLHFGPGHVRASF